MFGLLLLAQATVAMPAYSPPTPADPPRYDPATLSVVIANTVSQTDPRPLCARADCTAMFLGTFKDARVLVGPSPGEKFAARMEMGSPFDQHYRIAMVIVHKHDGEIEVLTTRGFHYQTHLACFERSDTDPLNWHPEARDLSYDHGQLCVAEG
jgi:hypothetical protein